LGPARRLLGPARSAMSSELRDRPERWRSSSVAAASPPARKGGLERTLGNGFEGADDRGHQGPTEGEKSCGIRRSGRCSGACATSPGYSARGSPALSSARARHGGPATSLRSVSKVADRGVSGARAQAAGEWEKPRVDRRIIGRRIRIQGLFATPEGMPPAAGQFVSMRVRNVTRPEPEASAVSMPPARRACDDPAPG